MSTEPEVGPRPATHVDELLREQIPLPRPRRRRRWPWVVLALLVVLFALSAIAARGTGYSYAPLPPAQLGPPADLPTDDPALAKFIARQKKRQTQLDTQLKKAAPSGVYVVIDQTQNRLYLKRDEDTLLEARCSAGSGMVLKEADGGKNRQWVFDTPRGLFKVKNRIKDPVWSKPDWAFVEEGKPIPKTPDDRLDYGTLGEYALYLGDGYMIHGTLYERLLGRSVTHGCIRLGRDDLRRVWAETGIGTPVYIY